MHVQVYFDQTLYQSLGSVRGGNSASSSSFVFIGSSVYHVVLGGASDWLGPVSWLSCDGSDDDCVPSSPPRGAGSSSFFGCSVSPVASHSVLLC